MHHFQGERQFEIKHTKFSISFAVMLDDIEGRNISAIITD